MLIGLVIKNPFLIRIGVFCCIVKNNCKISFNYFAKLKFSRKFTYHLERTGGY